MQTQPDARTDPREIAETMYRYDRPHEPLASPAAVGDDALDAFARDGFIAVENVLTPDEVAACRRAIRETIQADNGDEPWRRIVSYEPGTDRDALAADEREARVRKLFTFVDDVPTLADAAGNAALTGIVRKLAGEGVRLVQDMALLKPPGGGVEKPWHQDAAYFRLSTPEAVIGTWIALDEATPENGCMHVIPGSHRAGPRPHYHARDCQLPDDAVEVERDVVVPLRPGGAMFFSGLVHHGTPANFSGSPRWALQFHYMGVSGLEAEDPAVLTSLFGDRQGFAGCQGWALGVKTRPLHLRADF